MNQTQIDQHETVKKKKTIADIATELGVSCSTISKAINNKPGVGAELRQTILQKVSEIGYLPNPLARGLIKGRVNVVAVVMGDIRNPFYADIAFYLQKTLNENGYLTMTFSAGGQYDAHLEYQFVQAALQLNVAGLVLVALQSEKLEEVFSANHIPIVMVNRALNSFEGDRIILDNFQTGYMATKHLIRQGHTEIDFLMAKSSSSAVQLRYQGYKQVLDVHHIRHPEEAICYGEELTPRVGANAAKALLKDIDHLPSAFVLPNDNMAIGFLDYCFSVGIRIPEMISVIGCDNISWDNLYEIQLTTIDHQAKTVSDHASRMIIDAIENSKHKTEQIILEPQIIERNSTGPFNPQWREKIKNVISSQTW